MHQAPPFKCSRQAAPTHQQQVRQHSLRLLLAVVVAAAAVVVVKLEILALMAALVAAAAALERDLGFTQPLRWEPTPALPWVVAVVAGLAQVYLMVITLVTMAALVVIRNVILMEQD